MQPGALHLPQLRFGALLASHSVGSGTGGGGGGALSAACIGMSLLCCDGVVGAGGAVVSFGSF